MSAGIIFYVLFALFLKHLVIDFPIYSNYICRDIDTPGVVWYTHIILHGLATAGVLLIIKIPLGICILLGIIDLFIHALIDALMIYCGKRCRNDANFKSKFSWVVNIDQYLHTLMYVFLTFGLVLIL